MRFGLRGGWASGIRRSRHGGAGEGPNGRSPFYLLASLFVFKFNVRFSVRRSGSGFAGEPEPNSANPEPNTEKVNANREPNTEKVNTNREPSTQKSEPPLHAEDPKPRPWHGRIERGR